MTFWEEDWRPEIAPVKMGFLGSRMSPGVMLISMSSWYSLLKGVSTVAVMRCLVEGRWIGRNNFTAATLQTI